MPTPEQLQDALRELQLARFHRSGRMWREAAQHYARALGGMPPNAAVLGELADVAVELRDWNLVVAVSRDLLALRAEPKTEWRLGVALFQLQRHEEAIAHFRAYAAHKPGYFVEFNLGLCCNHLRRFEEAAAHFRRALRHDATRPEVFAQLATALALCNDIPAAAQVIAQGRAAFPENADIGYLAAEHELRSERFGAGFDLYHHRWHAHESGLLPRNLPWPQWQGEPFDGPLVVWAEQGLGDEILYAGMFGDVMARHADVAFECDPRLKALLARSLPGIRLLDRKADEILTVAPGPAARQCAAGDLGAIVRRDAADFPVRTGWMKPDAARVAQIRADYQSRFPGELLVGISWRSKRRGVTETKSVPLEELAPVLRVPGVRFVNLQYGDVAEDIARVKSALGVELLVDTTIDPWNDLDAFAAQVAALDAVVSVSNTTVHFAGALGVPCIALINRDAGMMWYWPYTAATCRWYPSVVPMRTARRGEWAPVIDAAAGMIAERVAQHGGSS